MAGPTSLRSQKGILTRYCNVLSQNITKGEEIAKLDPSSFTNLDASQRAQTIAFELKATSKLVSDTRSSFTATVDSLIDALSEEQEQQALEYIEKAHIALERAHDLAIRIEANRVSVREHGQIPVDFSPEPPSAHIGMAMPKLPAIPIPIFSGKVWEFNNFWTLFDASVHSQTLTKLQKFNYLISALRGEARDLIRRFPVTEQNYDHAIDLLRTKYGDESALIAKLQARLESAKADNSSIQAQRKLLEYVISIVIQLEELGIHLNGSFSTQKLLSKFSAYIQRKVLEMRFHPNMQESDWKMRDILTVLDNQITTEERIKEMVDKCDHLSKRSYGGEFRPQNTKSMVQASLSCMFCKAPDHRTLWCKKYPTPMERRNYLRSHNLCLNCAREGHFVKDCTRDGCKLCNGKKHHYSLCPQKNLTIGTQDGKGTAARETRDTVTRKSTKTAYGQQRDKQRSAHVVQAETGECATPQIVHDEDQTNVVLLTDRSALSAPKEKVLLLTGLARVRNELRNQWQDRLRTFVTRRAAAREFARGATFSSLAKTPRGFVAHSALFAAFAKGRVTNVT
ncbi:hypothetical protein Aduo_012650 [Ancylostoma duodenale]